jgi:hypothetical protein
MLPACISDLQGTTLATDALHICSWRTDCPHPLNFCCTSHNMCSPFSLPFLPSSFSQPNYCEWIAKGTASPLLDILSSK